MDGPVSYRRRLPGLTVRPGLDSPCAMAVALGQVPTQEESQALFPAARDAVLVVDDARTFVDILALIGC